MPMRRPQAQRTPQGTSPTATRPWAYRPARSPPSGSVNHTSTRPWAHQAHCHSPLGRVDSVRSIPSGSVRRTATRPLSAPTAPIALPLGPQRTESRCHSPLNVPPRTFTAEWQCEPHFHSALGAPSALPLGPGRTSRTATRPLGAPTALIALPLAPERTVRTAKRPEPLSYRPWVRFWQAIDVFRVIPRSHHAMGPIESALVSLAAGTPGQGLGDPSSFESIHP